MSLCPKIVRAIRWDMLPGPPEVLDASSGVSSATPRSLSRDCVRSSARRAHRGGEIEALKTHVFVYLY